ncbi:hypothetical protein HOD08_03305 [bacterium]|nr:hypothetical protein [bacterium]
MTKFSSRIQTTFLVVAVLTGGTTTTLSAPIKEPMQTIKAPSLTTKETLALAFLPSFFTDDIIEKFAFGIAGADFEYRLFSGIKMLQRIHKFWGFFKKYIEALQFVCSDRFARIIDTLDAVLPVIPKIVHALANMTPEQINMILSMPELIQKFMNDPRFQENFSQLNEFFNQSQHASMMQKAQEAFFESEDFKDIVAQGMKEWNQTPRNFRPKSSSTRTNSELQWSQEMAERFAQKLVLQQQSEQNFAGRVAERLRGDRYTW